MVLKILGAYKGKNLVSRFGLLVDLLRISHVSSQMQGPLLFFCCFFEHRHRLIKKNETEVLPQKGRQHRHIQTWEVFFLVGMYFKWACYKESNSFEGVSLKVRNAPTLILQIVHQCGDDHGPSLAAIRKCVLEWFWCLIDHHGLPCNI